MDQFDGFSISLYKDEDGDWLAYFAEMPNISAFSDTPENALRELGTAWEAVRESFQKHNEPIPSPPDIGTYDGCLDLRIDRQLHRTLAVEAVGEGVTLNELVSRKLAVSAARQSYAAE